LQLIAGMEIALEVAGQRGGLCLPFTYAEDLGHVCRGDPRGGDPARARL
jgi:hypothetical protein